MAVNPLLTLSGTKLAAMIRNREVTSCEVVETHIDRIRKVNPVINAVVKDRFDEARAEAEKADKKTKSVPPEKLPPFHGVPCTIKECISLTGMPNTSGLVSRKGIVGKEDAPTVARLRKAGIIPLGVTNIPELCMWIETYSRVYGRTRNPYNPGRIAGGSSGGEGAIVGAGGVPFGLGSDIGGSIRLPAFFNGVFGHKPSGGMVPNTGHFPLPGRVGLRYLSPGPLARRAEDLMPLLKILAGPDRHDPVCTHMDIHDASKVKIEGLNVLDIGGNGFVSVSRDLRAAQKKCIEALTGRGALVRKVKIEGLKRSFFIVVSSLSATGKPTFRELLGGGTPINPFFQLVKWMFGRSPHTLPSLFTAVIENVPKLTISWRKKFVEAGLALKRELTDLIGPNGVMLYPSFSRPAPVHDRPLLRPFDFAYTAILNIMEFPVTQVPLGLNDEGIPLGVQVAGIHGNDHLTIGVALELEKMFGGWVPPGDLR